MAIIARFKTEYYDEQVEVLDVYESGDTKMASIKALEGRPFVGGAKFFTMTEYTTTQASNLTDIRQDPPVETTEQATRKSLLDLALEQAREQWHNGQSVWIWKGERSGAYLKNDGQGRVHLYLSDRQPGCLIYELDRQGWEVNNKVRTDYRRWLEVVQS